MIKMLIAPWPPEIVQALEKYQSNLMYHPYTCGKNSNHILKPTEIGLVCEECNYTQNWCHQLPESILKP